MLRSLTLAAGIVLMSAGSAGAMCGAKGAQQPMSGAAQCGGMMHMPGMGPGMGRGMGGMMMQGKDASEPGKDAKSAPDGMGMMKASPQAAPMRMACCCSGQSGGKGGAMCGGMAGMQTGGDKDPLLNDPMWGGKQEQHEHQPQQQTPKP